MKEETCDIDKECPLTLECDLKNVIKDIQAENEKMKKGIMAIVNNTKWDSECESDNGLHEEYGYIKRYDF